MKNYTIIFCLLMFVSCGRNGSNGTNGVDGISRQGLDGADAISTGIDFSDIEPGLACANGGISVFTFRDENSDGLLQSNESIIKVKAICNGLNGTNGTNASVSLENINSSESCPAGGVKIFSSSSEPVEVCNGVNGLNGEQGAQGLPGTSILPVKFCTDDNSSYPEYGLMIGEDLYAVYWGTTPGSPSAPQAFLTKLVAGNYQSTGGNNCLFRVD